MRSIWNNASTVPPINTPKYFCSAPRNIVLYFHKKKTVNGKALKVPDYNQDFGIRHFYAQLIEHGGLQSKERWVEKTPRNIHFVEKLIGYFGEGTRFIHIVRDGRDVVTSTHPSSPDKYWVLPERWVLDVSAGRKAEKYSQVLTVRYEDLVSSPGSTMREVFAFLGESYPAEIDEYPRTAQVKTSNAWDKKAREIDSKSVRRWKKPEHANVVKQLTNLPGAPDLLEYYGYM